MTSALAIDAHCHYGNLGGFFEPEFNAEHLLAGMGKAGIGHAVCSDVLSVFEGAEAGLAPLRGLFESSGRRVYFLGTFDPRRPAACLGALEQAKNWPGFVGLKLHPSVHGVPADDSAYELAWRFAADNDVAIMTHSWSVSSYNPVQYLSTPRRFEVYVRKFPQVRFVLGHAGGRGQGRGEAIRMVNDYPQVHLDFAGDIYDYRLLEKLIGSVPATKILFGSDSPMMDPRSQLSLVLLAGLADSAKSQILRGNAIRVYRLEVS
jgi:hypothetical protein